MRIVCDDQHIETTEGFCEQVADASGQDIEACYQCGKCTAGCPLAEYFDLAPNQVMRAAQLGMDDTVLQAKTPWLCASCQTCSTRCPQGIDVARVMDFMVMEALARGIHLMAIEWEEAVPVILEKAGLLPRPVVERVSA